MSCKNKSVDKETILIADIDTPMGHNSLRIFSDHRFWLEHRRLLKRTIYEGTVTLSQDTLHFKYDGSAPDFGDKAEIDGIFLTFTNGVTRELLEISLNKLSK